MAVGVAAVAAIIFLTQWAQQPEYSAAFTGLPESDASAIVAKLKEMKVPYELSDGGATVRVPADKVYEVRLQLVALGLPKGGTIGFELFDKLSFGLTDFAQKLNFRRALEGELSRTISRISGVEEARVHIVLPQNELFVEKEKSATASVALRLKPGTELDARQVRGIANLVSRSVEGLKPDNVTVVDGDGITLSGQDDLAASAAGSSSAQRDAQRGYERALQRDIQAMLEQVLGARRAVVRVSTAFDWDQRESSTETYSPNGKEAQVRSSREVTERSSGAPTDAGSGLPTYPLDPRSPAGRTALAADADASASDADPQVPGSGARTPAVEPSYERREVVNNYEISKVVERTVRAPGTIKKLSVAVMLDGQLDAEVVGTVSKAVTAAAGLDADRGDSVVVAQLPFDRAAIDAQEQARQETASRETYLAVARAATSAVSLLLVMLLVRSVIRGLTRGTRREYRRSAPAHEPRMVAASTRRELEELENDRPRLIQRQVSDMARSQPKLVAGILRSWLDER